MKLFERVLFSVIVLILLGFILSCLTGCVSLDVGLKRRDVPLTSFYTYLPYVDLEIGAVED